MVKTVNIIVNENSFEMYESSKNIIGEVFFKVENEYFPQRDWSDFAVVILSWWIEEFKKMLNSTKNSSCKLFFMDGPYYVNCIKIDDNIIELEFTEREEVNFTIKSSLNQLLEALVKASEKTIDIINLNNWENTDTEDLKSKINTIKDLK